jgi:hypothetical protein
VPALFCALKEGSSASLIADNQLFPVHPAWSQGLTASTGAGKQTRRHLTYKHVGVYVLNAYVFMLQTPTCLLQKSLIVIEDINPPASEWRKKGAQAGLQAVHQVRPVNNPGKSQA